jgi:threonine dehydrogenase-like Zn-dependent dehydrogenase
MVPLPAEFRTVGVRTEPLTIAQKALDELWRAQDRLPWTEPGANGDGRGRGHRAVVLRALRILGPNGVLVLTGGPGPEPSRSVDVSALVRQMVLGNQLVLGTVNAGRRANESAVQSLAAFHRRWPSELQALITGRHPLDEVPELLTARSSGIKDIVVLEDAP